MQLEQGLVDMLLEAPESQIDFWVKEDIKGMGLNPTALDILFVLDQMVFFSGASDFIVSVFEGMLGVAILKENTSLDELKEKINWTPPDFKRN